MEFFLTGLINGLSLGGIYAMIALGYTMVYGIAKMLNFAHGDVIMVGGYSIFVFMAFTNPFVATLFAVVLSVLLGVTIEKVAYKPLRGASPLAVLITAIGVSYLLQSLA
jgi:branched-chain amino acid transport system permease protein